MDGLTMPLHGQGRCLDGDTDEVVAELLYGTPTKTVPAKLWSDPTSDPLGDIRGALSLVSSASGASADIVIMGKSAADAFESNTNVMNAYNKQRIAPGQLAPATVGWGIQSLGTYRGIPLYVYEAEYLNSAGTLTPYVPPDNVLIAASSLGGTMAYAGIAQVDAGRVASRFTRLGGFRSWPSKPWKTTGNSACLLVRFPCLKTWQRGACSTFCNSTLEKTKIMSEQSHFNPHPAFPISSEPMTRATGKR